MSTETKYEHPGTWLPGDQIIASNGSVYERLTNGEWLGHDTQLVGFSDDGHADRHLHRNDSARITHLVPREAVRFRGDSKVEGVGTVDLPPVLPNPREEGWVKRAPGDVIEAGTPFVVKFNDRATIGDPRNTEFIVGTETSSICSYWTPPPSSPEPWERIPEGRENAQALVVNGVVGTWFAEQDDHGTPVVRIVWDLDEDGHSAIMVAHEVHTVEPLHTFSPDTNVPVERALIDEAAEYVASRESTLPGNWVRVPTHVIESLAALADGAES